MDYDKFEPPYKFSMNNIKALVSSDIRIGGAGLIFVDIIIVSIIITLVYRRGRYYKWLVSSILIIFVSMLVLPLGFWYRYVPFISFIPTFVILYLELNNYVRKWRNIIAIALCLNLFATFGVVVGYNVLYRITTDKYISKIKSEDVSVKTNLWSFIYKLNGNKYDSSQKLEETDMTSCEKSGYYNMPMSSFVFLKDENE
jgi:hypothetical protein